MSHSNFYSDAKWCIENDYQVYIIPIDSQFCIAIRRGGISSEGKDWYYKEDFRIETPEVLGTLRYKTVDKAEEKIHDVYKYLRNLIENR